jgi:F-type H+-transporting ATPase subunit delta
MRNRAVAARYARALIEVGVKGGDPQTVEQDMAAFAQLIGAHPLLQKMLLNRAIPAARKRAVVADLLQRVGPLSPVVERLVLLLAERDRMKVLPDVLDDYRDRLLEHQQIVRARVASAVPLAPDRVQRFERGLEAATGKRVAITTEVNPDLIGGIVAQVGSTVFDASVARHLARLKEQLAGRG